jgi:integrase/recombinase XerD
MYFTVARIATALINDPSLSPRTRRLYEGILLPFVERVGNRLVGTVRRNDIEQYLASLTHLSVRTHHLHQTIIHRLFSYAVEKGHTEVNPAAHLKRRKPDARKGEHGSDERVRHLTKKQLQVLFKATERNRRLNALLSLLHESGARIAEVLALRVADIDFSARQFSVVGKGNKRRWCFFGARTEVALRTYLKGERHHPHTSLFTERGAYRNDVRPLSYDTAYRDLRRAIGEYASLQGIRFHDLRHTFATERARIVPLELLRALLGHESIQTTLLYQKITSSVARAVAHQALEELA